MPYRIKRGETVRQGVERIAMEQIRRARRELRGDAPDAAEAVHQARKRFKKLRALLRLVRPVMSQQVFKAENRFFRDKARALASARDDQVMLDTLETLGAGGSEESVPEELAGLRDRLAARRDAHLQSGGEDLGDRMSEVAEALERYPDRIADWRIWAKGFEALAPGLERSYREGRKALKAVCKKPDQVRFHEWRKRVKDHWYHSRLLTGLWPEVMEARGVELSRLADLLGDEHDLAVFGQTLDTAAKESLTPEAEKRLLRQVSRRQKRLRRKALVLGRRVYAEKPKRLRQRWTAYWEAWHQG